MSARTKSGARSPRSARAFDEHTMNVFCVMARTAGTESTAKDDVHRLNGNERKEQWCRAPFPVSPYPEAPLFVVVHDRHSHRASRTSQLRSDHPFAGLEHPQAGNHQNASEHEQQGVKFFQQLDARKNEHHPHEERTDDAIIIQHLVVPPCLQAYARKMSRKTKMLSTLKDFSRGSRSESLDLLPSSANNKSKY